MWVMKDYGVQESWTKTIVVEGLYLPELDNDVYEPLVFLRNGEILLCYNDWIVVCYNQGTKSLRETRVAQTGSHFRAIGYNPSFVSLQEVAKGEKVRSTANATYLTFSPMTFLACLVLLISLLALRISPSQLATICASQKFKNNKLYANCTDLSTLSSYLHWTYNASNSSLAVAFVAAPSKSGGWIAWAINPFGTKMRNTQALVAHTVDDGTPVRQDLHHLSALPHGSGEVLLRHLGHQRRVQRRNPKDLRDRQASGKDGDGAPALAGGSRNQQDHRFSLEARLTPCQSQLARSLEPCGYGNHQYQR
ncbi:hypothetical protein M0R45_001574 [Rubus argutus]|uniref:Uncharacterized protein n=1 Tax=Rubus argutus TaxID=59490 RepID=A0AAW1VI24_RUBAR